MTRWISMVSGTSRILSVAADKLPRPGVPGYMSHLRRRYRQGLISQEEQIALIRLHRESIEAVEPPLGEDALVNALINVFGAVPVERSAMDEPCPPGCAYRAHREAGLNWFIGTHEVCGVCHPNPERLRAHDAGHGDAEPIRDDAANEAET